MIALNVATFVGSINGAIVFSFTTSSILTRGHIQNDGPTSCALEYRVQREPVSFSRDEFIEVEGFFPELHLPVTD